MTVKRVLVVGGAGFLGRNIVEDCIERNIHVAVFDIIKPDFFNKPPYSSVKFYLGDLCKSEDVENALRDFQVDTVICPASPNPLSTDVKLFYKVNVEGTKNLLKCCKENGVKRFVLTSSASVVMNDGKPTINADETLPYSKNPTSDYAITKIEQEKLVIAANGKDFKTVVLRPHRLWGPGDTSLIPKLIASGKAGRTKFYFGKDNNLVDWTYIKNASYSHILAAEKLASDPDVVGGQKYFITNDEPVPFWGHAGTILENLGYTRPYIKIPYIVILFISYFLAFISYLLSFIGVTWSPPEEWKTKNHTYMIYDHYFNISKAKKELGYKPIVSMKEGLKKTCDYFVEKK